MQKHDFTFKSLCSYVLYRAMEEEKTANTGLYESNQLSPADCERISNILRKIVKEGRLTCGTDTIVDDTVSLRRKPSCGVCREAVILQPESFIKKSTAMHDNEQRQSPMLFHDVAITRKNK